MTSITASDHQIDTFGYWNYAPMNTNINDYEIRRLGYKAYGVYLKNAPWAKLIAKYKCSHLEARRRWAMVLVTKRLRA